MMCPLRLGGIHDHLSLLVAEPCVNIVFALVFLIMEQCSRCIGSLMRIISMGQSSFFPLLHDARPAIDFLFPSQLGRKTRQSLGQCHRFALFTKTKYAAEILFRIAAQVFIRQWVFVTLTFAYHVQFHVQRQLHASGRGNLILPRAPPRPAARTESALSVRRGQSVLYSPWSHCTRHIIGPDHHGHNIETQ